MKKLKILSVLLISYIFFSYNYSSASAWSEFGQAMNNLSNGVINIFSPVRSVFNFLWELIQFLYYGFRTIVFLIWNLLSSVFFGLTGLFNRLIDTFTQLSFFLGSTTSMIVSMFVIVLMIIIFQFLLRFFTGRYHYKKVSNGK